MRIWIVILLISALGAQTAAPDGKSTNAPSPNRKNGESIFVSYGFYQCHGYAAQGGAGPRLGPKPIAFGAFLKYLRHPTGDMPPYTAKVVSDPEVSDIYAFLESMPAPPLAKDIELLK